MNFFEYHKLSARETEICKMLMVGKCRKQIAAELGADYKTVTHSARRAFRKIGCRNDVDLLWQLLAYREGSALIVTGAHKKTYIDGRASNGY